MIDALKELAERLGSDISITQFYRETGINDTNVYLLFQNWADLRVQAGLPPRINRRSGLRSTRKSSCWIGSSRRRRSSARTSPWENSRGDGCHESAGSRGCSARLKPAGCGLRTSVRADSLFDSPMKSWSSRLRELVKKRGDISRRQFCREVGISNNGLSGVVSWGELRKAIDRAAACAEWEVDVEKEHLAQIPESLKVDLFPGTKSSTTWSRCRWVVQRSGNPKGLTWNGERFT
ncbi:MAG: hypothetical protein R3C02_14280 [Planctomycetaceae bacterium]